MPLAEPAAVLLSSAAGASAAKLWPGAPESDESITFEAILGGAVGPETAAAAHEYLESVDGLREGGTNAAPGTSTTTVHGI